MSTTIKRPVSALVGKNSRPLADKSNRSGGGGNSYCAQLRQENPYKEKELRQRANHVAFSPVEIIHEVNEDANSSYQSSTEFNQMAGIAGGSSRRQQADLRPTHSQVIHILISQNDNEPMSPNGKETPGQPQGDTKRKKAMGYNSAFIKCLADLLTTKETITTLRSLSRHFNRAMRIYLPARLQQQAWFINAFLEENSLYND